MNGQSRVAKRLSGKCVGVSTIALISAISAYGATAAEIDTGSNVKIRWDNTFKYSVGTRVAGSDSAIGDNPTSVHALNQNDGDRSFKRWSLTSNRADLLSEFNASIQGFGVRISGAAWYDDVYQHSHANVPAQLYNAPGATDSFTDGARIHQGQNAELQDAFLFGKVAVGEVPVRFRAGRHTLLWGESLFLASNGIAYGQAPIDAAKATSVPNTQAKEVFMPVGQLSVQVQPTEALSIEAYWQPEWRPVRLSPAGTFFSTSDFLGKGGERMLVPGYAPGIFPLNNLWLGRGKDIRPSSITDQMGLAVKYSVDSIGVDLGLYALQYDDKGPQIYGHLSPGFPFTPLGDYQVAYAQDVRMYGVSASTQVGDWNVGGEVSYRQNTPLISGDRGVMIGVPVNADGGDNRQFATGDSLHAQVSGILLLGPTALWDGGTVLGEIGGHRRVSVDRNLAALDLTRSRQAFGARAVFEPAFFQVFPGVDMSVPLSFGHTIGESPVDMGFNNGAPDRGGDVSIGVKADYEKTWFVSANYTHYYGGTDQQFLLGHDFISLSVQRTF